VARKSPICVGVVREIMGLRMGRLPLLVGGSPYYVIVPLVENKSELRLPPSCTLTLRSFHGSERDRLLRLTARLLIDAAGSNGRLNTIPCIDFDKACAGEASVWLCSAKA
jgi:hypothetical protein